MAAWRAGLALLAIVFVTHALPAAAAPRLHGVPRVTWRNAGHGRVARAALPRVSRQPIARGPYFARLAKGDEGWQWSDDGHDAVLPRASAPAAVVPIASVRVTVPVYVRPASFRRFCGRAPPAL